MGYQAHSGWEYSKQALRATGPVYVLLSHVFLSSIPQETFLATSPILANVPATSPRPLGNRADASRGCSPTPPSPAIGVNAHTVCAHVRYGRAQIRFPLTWALALQAAAVSVTFVYPVPRFSLLLSRSMIQDLRPTSSDSPGVPCLRHEPPSMQDAAEVSQNGRE
jgi:hypothetical protein